MCAEPPPLSHVTATAPGTRHIASTRSSALDQALAEDRGLARRDPLLHLVELRVGIGKHDAEPHVLELPLAVDARIMAAVTALEPGAPHAHVAAWGAEFADVTVPCPLAVCDVGVRLDVDDRR